MEYTSKWLKFMRWFLSNPKFSGFFIFIILSLGVVYTIQQRIEIINENEHDEMQKILENLRQNIDQCLKSSYTSTLTLALTINDEGIPENFNTIGSQLISSNDWISAVQLVPNGVIKYIYPLRGNESAMNLNLLSTSKLRKEAMQSIISGKMYFAGPLTLKQGGVGIIGRLPIYKKNKFWGFSAVIIKFDDLLKKSGINSINNSKYSFQFSKKNPDTQKEVFFLPVKKNIYKNHQISATIPDGNWKIYLIKIKDPQLYSVLIIPAILGIVLSVIFGAFVTILLNRPKRLQELVIIQAEKLLNSELKFKTIFERAPIGIAIVDNLTGNFLEINKKFCDLLEYSEKEMKLKNYQSITHPTDLISGEQKVAVIHEGSKKAFTLKKRYITKFGKNVWVNLTIAPLYKSDRKSTINIAIVEDITLQKKILENLKKSETQFKNLFKNSPIPLWEVDFSLIRDYLKKINLIGKDPKIVEYYIKEHPEVVQQCFPLIKIIAVNYECLKMLNIESKEFLIHNLEQIHDTQTVNDFIRQLIAVTQNKYQLKYDSQIKNSIGESIDIHFRWNVVRGYEKTFERIIVSTEDITFRKKNEKMVLNSQQRIESIINTIDGIVWECEIETLVFTFVSKKVEQILGYTPEEWINEPDFWKNHIHPEDREFAIEFCSIKTKDLSNHDLEYRMVCKNGAIIWVRDMVNIVYENGKAVSLHGIMIDITKSKNIERVLNNSFNLVSKQNERLLNFSYIISHNLRSHTSNISSIISLIISSETKEERLELMEILVSVSQLLNETMTHLNEVINIRTNVNLSIESLKLKEYIDNARKIFSNQLISKKVTINNLVPDDIMINYNPAYLESILYNLISNAIRYSHPERKSIIDLKFKYEKDKKILEISDNGIGIDLVKNGNKIFGMYKTFSDNPSSKGIGLFITKNQIEAMGGTITVDSEPNIGTKFKIEIL
jgi:PAS domain S-box-containing protein